mmetsp:Transcript_19005/g.43695  ORF Transcript_19005/g.43695 Transcript_19005/m.43695 type:complete len:95 (-) Transcript_19005:34-318(-)
MCSVQSSIGRRKCERPDEQFFSSHRHAARATTWRRQHAKCPGYSLTTSIHAARVKQNRDAVCALCSVRSGLEHENIVDILSMIHIIYLYVPSCS